MAPTATRRETARSNEHTRTGHAQRQPAGGRTLRRSHMATLAPEQFPRSGYITRSSSSGLADVLEVLLDKGIVIDVFLRVSLVGIELLTVDARIVIASVDTYLSFAEAVNRLDLGESSSEGLPQLVSQMSQDGAESKTKGVLEGAKQAIFG